MRGSLAPSITAAASCLLSSLSFVFAAEPFFDEDFGSAAQNPNLENYAPYYTVQGGVLQRQASSEFSDRRYLRTLVADYNTRDFTLELTCTTNQEIVFIGVGEGIRSGGYNEPGNSVFLALAPQSIQGGVVIRTVTGDVQIDRLYSTGPHRVRIEKNGTAITFQVDEGYDGNFTPDISVTLVDLAEVGPFLNDRNSRLFFGTIGPQEKFDDLSIQEPAAPPADCNRNGVPDADDLANGSSKDQNSDGVPDECQAARWYFAEDFNQAVTNPSLTGYSSYFSIADGVIRRTGNTAFDDRQYVRTAKSDYNTRDFVYELTFTTTDDIIFMGIGEGVRGGAYNEPANSCNFRLHPQVHHGVVGVTTADQGEVEIGKLTSEGPHRARIEKKGAKITFSVDDNFDGTFKATMSRAFNNLATIGPFLNSRNSRLFFGAVIPAAYFDDLSITNPSLGGPDCNGNGVLDATDISTGASKDTNQDGVPDECQLIPGTVELVASGPGCVKVVLTNAVAVKGGEIGLAYDPQAVVPVGVTPGADLPPSAALRFDPAPGTNCPPESGEAAGLTLGWINSITESILTPLGRHEILEVCFALPPEAFLGGTYPLKFVRCLGVAEAPVRNVVTDADGKSQLVVTRDGAVAVSGKPIFRRGDANEDGGFDISDSIRIFGCLFLGDRCAACRDAMDSNDDGGLDLTDGIYLLNWRFLNGAPPPAPFPDCGPDRKDDALAACEQQPSCP